MPELSNDDKKAVWMFVNTIAKILIDNKHTVNYDGRMMISLDGLVQEFAAKYNIESYLVDESIKRYVIEGKDKLAKEEKNR